jgi:3-oxoacyl-[acyl-carrier protein] reductase
MADLDFTGKRVLVVGGSSGIGNGIAHGFRERGARVAVWGTRDEGDYRVEDGSDLTGLDFFRVDASDNAAVEAAPAPFDGLDVLVLAQGTVLYRKGEFDMDGFRKVVGVNLDSLMACALKFHEALKASGGNIVTISSTAA